MRRWWSNRSVGARGAFVAGSLIVLLLVWGVADRVVLDKYRDDRQAHAISQEEYDAVADGEEQTKLVARLGEPEGGADESGEGCVSYKERGAPLLQERTYRFCFKGGDLILKDFAPIEDPDELRSGKILQGD